MLISRLYPQIISLTLYICSILHEQECLISQMNEAYQEFDEKLLNLRSDKIKMDVEVYFVHFVNDIVLV